MSRDRPIEHLIEATLAEDARGRAPDDVLARILESTAAVEPLPRWRAVIAEPPMRHRGRVAAGAPVARAAYLALVTVLLVAGILAAVVAATMLLPRPAPSAPRTIVVDQQGAGDVRTIGEALSQGRDGDTIVIRAGIYAESPLVTRDVVMEGEGDGDAVVLLVGDAQDPGEGLVLRAPAARLRNLTVRPAGPGVAPVLVDGGAPSLVDLWVDSPAFSDSGSPPAVRFSGGTTASLNDSLVSWTEVDGASSPTIFGGSLAGEIIVRPGSSLVVRDVHVPHVVVAQGASATIDDNTFVPLPGSPAGLAGIVVEGAANVSGNTLEGAYPVGIDVTSSAPVRIERNTVTVKGTGARVSGAGVTLTGNELIGGTNGVVVANGSTPNLRDNRIERNQVGIVVEAGADPVLVDNVLCANGSDLVSDEPDVTLEGNSACVPRPTPRPIDSRGAS